MLKAFTLFNVNLSTFLTFQYEEQLFHNDGKFNKKLAIYKFYILIHISTTLLFNFNYFWFFLIKRTKLKQQDIRISLCL